VTKLAGLFALALAVAGLIVGPAGATSPTVTEMVVDRTFTLAAGTACSFPLTIHDEGIRRTTTFFDAEGNVTKTMIVLINFTESYTNEDTGAFLSTPAAGPAIIEPNGDGTVTTFVPGNDGRLIVPGEGFIYGDVGLRVFTASAATPFTPLEILLLTGHYESPSRYLEAVCSSLS
jgi:hypothetical protein